MGDSGALILAFPYSSDLSNESKQNPMLALGESISFGRFMSESLSWEKWSTFSHKKYVEEAESYSKPGSVAQKKAFFEAHYKRIAARKAAALPEQENENSLDEQNIHHEQHDEDVEKVVPNEVPSDKVDQTPPVTEKEALMETPSRKISMNQVHNLENNDIVNGSKTSDDLPKVDKSLFKVIEIDKQNSIAEREKTSLPVARKKKSVLSLLKSWFHPKTSEVHSTNKSRSKTRPERIDAKEQENSGRKAGKTRRFLCFKA